MTRSKHKAYNAENYPASVLTWLNEVVDRVIDDFEKNACDGCKHEPIMGENYPEVCGNCSRFYVDYKEAEDD